MRTVAMILLLSLQAKDNPHFEGWKNFKAGSWVKLKVETIEDGEKTLSDDTETLVSAADNKVVIERKSLTQLGGQPFTATDKEEIPAASDVITKVVKGDDEEIEVAGKKLACKVVFVSRKASDSSGPQRLKLWTHADVPGGVARSETVSLKGNRIVATAVAVGWEKK